MPDLRLRILLVDEEGGPVRERLGSYLRTAGHFVFETRDAQQALAAADRELPDAMVTGPLTAPLDAVELCWAVRKTSRVPLCTYVVLKSRPSPQYRLEAYRAGVDLVVDTEAKVQEIEVFLRSQTALRRGFHVPDLLLAGNLSKIGLLTLLQLVCNINATGRVEMADTDGRRGRIYLRRGQIVHAELEEASGRDALLQLAAIREGSYQLFRENVTVKQTVDTPSPQLLLEIAAYLDERRGDTRK